MQAVGVSGTGSGFFGRVSVGGLDGQSLQEPETSKAGATRFVLVEVVLAFWVDLDIKQGHIWAHQSTSRLDCWKV